jgi:M6 family metalloprotease-like protein
MKKRILILLIAVYCLGLFAIPAAPGIIDFNQQDGTTIQIYNRGDERLNWAETLDGYTLLNKDKSKVYAIKDAEGNLVPSDIIAHENNHRTQIELSFLNSIPKGLRYSALQSELAAQVRNARMGGFPTTGTQNMILILANFNDTNTTYSQSAFDNLMNQSNYSGTGSFKDYYFECSYGQLTVNTTVVGWVDVVNNHDYYGPDARWAEFVRDACQAADDLVDFSEFDNDNDGDVDGVAVIHQGRGQETTGDTSDIWSHNFSLSSGGISLYLDGVQIKDYTCQPEKTYYSMAGIGVICHEFGHNLGTPDFYDTDYQTNGNQDGTGEWDIMGSGAYNGGGDVPAHHNMWTKIFYGWVDAPELITDGNYTLDNAYEEAQAYYFTSPVDNEYYLLENVQQTGFGSELPGHGLLIYHVDGNWVNSHMGQNNINTTSHQGMYIIASNNVVNTGNAPYPSPGHEDFTDSSYPAIPSWGNYDIQKGLNNITEANGNISFNFFNDSYYTPTAVFEDVYNNQHFTVNEEINLNFEVISSIHSVDFVDIKVNGISQGTLFAEPYELSFTPNNSYIGHVPVEVTSYYGNENTVTELMIYIDPYNNVLLEDFESYTNATTDFQNWTNNDLDNQATLEVE